MIAPAKTSLDILLEGNKRFREGKSIPRSYSQEDLRELAHNQKPIAAVVACSDSRCTPSTVFDQPLGAVFTSRIPGNVISEGVKWMAELAVGDFKVPLLIIMAHTNCLAVQAVLQEKSNAPGGMLRYQIYPSVQEARQANSGDILSDAIKRNAKHSAERLIAESYIVKQAVEAKTLSIVSAIYNLETGEIEVIA